MSRKKKQKARFRPKRRGVGQTSSSTLRNPGAFADQQPLQVVNAQFSLTVSGQPVVVEGPLPTIQLVEQLSRELMATQLENSYLKEAMRQAATDETSEPWEPLAEMDTVVDPDGTKRSLKELPFRMWKNTKYTVTQHPEEPGRPVEDGGVGSMIHLSIRRNDRKAGIDWREFQQIKNQLVGSEAEALEIYPAETRLVDGANQYHLWCFPCFKFPFGFNERRVSESGEHGVAQRGWPESDRPEDVSNPAPGEMEAAKKRILGG